ncbi:glycosyltransferase [Nodosilinea nodulosa]|uniref:glycosyltransferase n=1 Tax=Nodosilinea nodulosa TaxID=416001 RepID=UPI00031DBFE6|nr:glycosyltransferase [Nodosilinea nodulosa]
MVVSPPPFVSIVVPVHNGGTAFKACLHSLEKFLPSPDQVTTEVIVVADGCTDGSDRLAEQFGATVLRTEHPGGPAQARNLGARQARGEILFFIDADVTIHPATVAQMAQMFIGDQGLAAAIGSYDDAPGASNFLSQYKNLFHHYTHQTGHEEASTFWGACGAVRREIFWATGGFDERFRQPSIEDIELGYRLKQSGHRIQLCKNILVKHLKRWEPVSLLRAEFFYRALPWTTLLLQQRHMLVNDLNLKVSTRVSIGLIFTIAGAMGGSLFLYQAAYLAGALALILLLINWSVYQFFYSKRGLAFALKAIPWHWLYFGYCGLAYGLGLARYYLARHYLIPKPT